MTPALSEGMVRVGPVGATPEVLKALGWDPSEVLAETGIDLQIFEDPDNLLSFSSRAHLLAVCRDLTACPHFGLMVGQRADLSSFGLVGYLAMHSQSVEAAIRSLVRYLHLHGQGGRLVLEQNGNTAFMGYEIYQALPDGADQLEDAAIALIYSVLRELCGGDWGPTDVWFTHRMPPDTRPFQDFLHAPLRFDRDKSGVFFSARWLQRSVRAADPELHRLLQKQIDELEERYRDEFPAQVRRVLHHALLSRQFSAEEVAALFSIHSRTLHRRLKANGTSFREISDDCRFSIARQMLETSDAPIMQIAELLDYADARAFGRAFKRWSGLSPGRWRKQHDVEFRQ